MKQSIAIIGGGSAALLCAAFLDTSKYNVCIYEKNKALGRKFLVAGDGGFNLTHSENIEIFITRYTPQHFLYQSLKEFSNQKLMDWLKAISINTFVGSSGRVYPEKNTKPIQVLEAVLKHLQNSGIAIKTNYHWKGWSDTNELVFENEGTIKADYVIFALGGASWKVTGSSGDWLSLFTQKGIPVLPFQASNCAFGIDWNKEFLTKHEGSPLKNIAFSYGTKVQKGEAVITKFGIEGNAIYALSPEIRKQLSELGEAQVFLDLKPMLTVEEVIEKILHSNKRSITEKLKTDLKLSAVQIDLLKSMITKEGFTVPDTLANSIKNLPLTIIKLAPIDEAISTVGGISLEAIDENYELKKLPNHFCIGEMLNWDAPTGGYLLQGSFSMGVFLANFLNRKLT